MASTLAKNICIEIFFEDDGHPTHIQLEECDDELDDEEYDEDFVPEES